jgi:hypothetical protein
MEWCPRCQKYVTVNRSVTKDAEKEEQRTEVVCAVCHTTLKAYTTHLTKGKHEGGGQNLSGSFL